MYKSLHTMKITRILLGVSSPQIQTSLRWNLDPLALGGGPSGSWHCLRSNILFSHGQGLFLPLLGSPRHRASMQPLLGMDHPRKEQLGRSGGCVSPSPATPGLRPLSRCSERRAPSPGAARLHSGPEGWLLTAHAYPLLSRSPLPDRSRLARRDQERPLMIDYLSQDRTGQLSPFASERVRLRGVFHTPELPMASGGAGRPTPNLGSGLRSPR